MSKSACPMIARSDWGIGQVQQRGMSHTHSNGQSTIGFHGPKTAGWIIFLNGPHRGEDLRIPIGETRIGSHWSSDHVLTGVGIGGHHLTIRAGLESSSIEPAAESRETKINNQRIKTLTPLADGNLISMGDLHGIYRSSQPLQRPVKIPTYEKPASLPLQSLPKYFVCGWLIYLKGSLMGRDFRLKNGVNRVGSAENLEISLPDGTSTPIAFTLDCHANKPFKITLVAPGRVIKINGTMADVGHSLTDSDIIAIDQMEMLVKCF